MTPEQFAYWLKGFYEISGAKEITAEQSQIIKDHLDNVFKKETPDRSKEPKQGSAKTPSIADIIEAMEKDKSLYAPKNPLLPAIVC